MESLVIIALVLLNGLLSMSEIALVTVRKSNLESQAKKGDRDAQKALKLVNRPDKFFSTIQIGITLIGVLTGLYSGEAYAASLSAVLADISWISPAYSLIISKTLIVVIVTYLTLIFGELVPKRIGMNYSERIAKAVAQPMQFISILASPFVLLLSASSALVMKIFGLKSQKDSAITEEEIKAIIKEGVSGGEILEIEEDIVGRVLSFDDRNIDSVMTHRAELVWLDMTADSMELIEKIKKNPNEIYPVTYGADLVNVKGVVYLKDIFAALYDDNFDVADYLQASLFIPETKNIHSVVELIRESQANCGFVVDEFGDIQGMVTIKDISEALLGQLDGSDPLAQEIIERADGAGWLVDGQYPFYDFLEYFDAQELFDDEHDCNTISGLVLEELEHIPNEGERFKWKMFTFEIVDMDGARIDKILVTKK